MICNFFRFFGQCLTVEISRILSIIIYTGVYQDSLKPTFKCHGNLQVSVFIKLMNIFEKLGEAFIDDFLNLVLIVLVTIANFHGISLQEFIQFLLAGAVILPASGYQCANLVVTIYQWF